MIVVSDTSPINYLVLIGHIDVLPVLFTEVAIPIAVEQELTRPETPQVVRSWLETQPSWFMVRQPKQVDQAIQLGAGETEAICLARELKADLLLMDDRRSRRVAESHGLSVVGTVNVLVAAAMRNLLELPKAIELLRTTNFHISAEVLSKALEVDARSRRHDGPHASS